MSGAANRLGYVVALCTRCGKQPRHMTKNGYVHSWCSECMRQNDLERKHRLRTVPVIPPRDERPLCAVCGKQPIYIAPGGHRGRLCQRCRQTRENQRRSERQYEQRQQQATKDQIIAMYDINDANDANDANEISNTCVECGRSPRYVTESGTRYTRCLDCHRKQQREYYETWKRVREEKEQKDHARQQAAPSQAVPTHEPTRPEQASDRALALRSSQTLEKQDRDEEEKAHAERIDGTIRADGLGAWHVLTNLTLFADKAGRMVQGGMATNIQVSADVPAGVRYTMSIGQTPGSGSDGETEQADA